MKIIKSLKSMRALAQQWRREAQKIVLVPTMGGLHEGHLSLIRRGRKAGDKLVVSIFVNPTQFGPREDYSRYPRTFTADKQKCREGGADVIFCPTAEAIYPDKFDTWVSPDVTGSILEGAARPTHFRGVCTIVLKLFNIVLPHTAVFGQKDYQQCLVVKRMVDDLNLPVRIIVSPIIRAADGLALSSRNAYLSPARRRTAGVIYRALCEAKKAIKDGKTQPALLTREVRKTIEGESEFQVEYVEFADPQTLKKQKTVQPPTVVLVAVRLGGIRFIDNLLIK